ncbi:hypothetical protein M406DRAFT_254757, partial [Cryphonectria parasitica EP155]
DMKSMAKTYNTGYSLMVTHLTTNPAVSGLFRGEQTGSQVLHYLWSYVLRLAKYNIIYIICVIR